MFSRDVQAVDAMTPYYEQDGIVIYHGDCRELAPLLAPVDVVITDPPYGVGMTAFTDDFSAVSALNLVSASLAAVFMSPRRVFQLAKVMSATWAFERMLWMHKAADIAAPWRGWCMNSEAILLFSRAKAAWPKPPSYCTDMYSVGPWERSGHPNGKPLEVVGDLVLRLSIGSVLDPFMGSGTTLVSAKRLGRRAIGIEIEERYCEIAARRLAQGALDLFGEGPAA